MGRELKLQTKTGREGQVRERERFVESETSRKLRSEARSGYKPARSLSEKRALSGLSISRYSCEKPKVEPELHAVEPVLAPSSVGETN